MAEKLPEKEKSFIRRIIEGEIGADEVLDGVPFSESPREAGLRQRRHKRKLTKKERRRAVVARLALLGYSTKTIAAELGVKPATVLRDMKAVYDEWKRSIAEDVDELKARELARIDRLEREYWEAWYRSIEAEVKSMEVSESDEKGRATRKAVKQWRVGKVEFLQGVQWCIDKRIEILGLKAPEKIDQRHLVMGKFDFTREDVKQEVTDKVLQGIVALVAGGNGGNPSAN